MSAGKIIVYITAAILIFVGVLFILGSFDPTGSFGWILVGIILVLIGFGLIWFATRLGNAPSTTPTQVNLKIDLSGDVNLESFKCQSCGSPLSPDNVKMVNGAPVVTCPFCGTSYQLTEEPKW
jgi:hypothetical protein